MPTTTSRDAPELRAQRTAADPDASSDALSQIADTFWGHAFFAYDRSRVRHYQAARAVARHPNTPLRALAQLAPYFPLEVSQNPGLELELVTTNLHARKPNLEGLLHLAVTREITPSLHAFLEGLWRDLGEPGTGALALAHHPTPALDSWSTPPTTASSAPPPWPSPPPSSTTSTTPQAAPKRPTRARQSSTA